MEGKKTSGKKNVNGKRKAPVEEEEINEDKNNTCLYQLLNVPKTASTADIVKLLCFAFLFPRKKPIDNWHSSSIPIKTQMILKLLKTSRKLMRLINY